MSVATPHAAHYERVVRDFCQRVGLHDSGAVAQGSTFEVDQVPLAFCLNETVPESPVVSIYVDVGLPLAGGELGVLRLLLLQNFHHSASRGVAYCISPATGHVVGVLHVGLGGLEGQGLEALVNSLVDSSLELMKSGLRFAPLHDGEDPAHGA